MPQFSPSTPPFVQVSGTFYRAVTQIAEMDALSGSRVAGRYSRPDQSTLYMSSTESGVEAAMKAHRLSAGQTRKILKFQVEADLIADLREDAIFNAICMQRQDALATWQDKVAQDQMPSSWAVRDAIEKMGAFGLIDPSRRAPGLWHLVLFRWNEPGAPSVTLPS